MPVGKIDFLFALTLPPEKAVAYLAAKKAVTADTWKQASEDARKNMFTVGKCAKLDIIQDIKDEMDAAVKAGLTFQDFKKDLLPRLQTKGWMADEGGAPRRLQTIYRTNMQTAFQAGRYKSFMNNVEDRPWFQFVAIVDERDCPICRAMNGRVYRYDDSIWKTHWPPLHFNCRCRTRALTDQEMKERGLKPSTARPPMPAPGFAYNPGMALYTPDLRKYDPEVRALYD